MKTSQLGIATALAATAAVAFSVACEQPKVRCATSAAVDSPDYAGLYPYWAQYIKVDGPAACDALKGEMVAALPYNPQDLAPEANGRPDLTKIFVAIRPASVGDLLDRLDKQELPSISDMKTTYSWGQFEAERPGTDDICKIPSFSAQTDVQFPAFPLIPAVPKTDDADAVEEVPALPATRFRYEWSNFQAWIRADAVGLQIFVDLTRTVESEGTTTTCKYKVKAVNPGYSCKDEDGKPSDAICNYHPDPNDGGSLTGSPINPDFKVKCDPDTLHCILDGDTLPALVSK